MPLGAFLAYTTAGSAIWATLLACAGYFMGSGFREVGEYLDPASWVVAGGLVLIYLVRVIRHDGARATAESAT
jgi:membrane protein DedA with SNARE-associated domain